MAGPIYLRLSKKAGLVAQTSDASDITSKVGSPAGITAQLPDAPGISIKVGNVAAGGGSSYRLPPATEKTLGGVKVGHALSITRDGVLSVECADVIEEDNTLPVTSAAVHTELGNIAVLLSTI